MKNIKDLATIQINKEDIKFSAAHFTIFSNKERERLHGHNFSVSLSITASVDENGMCFGYGEIKKKIRELCNGLDEYTLLPQNSHYLKINEFDEELIEAIYNEKKMYFLKEDTLVLPIRNTTVEELSRYLLDRLLQEHSDFFHKDNSIFSLSLKVSTGPGQSGASHWSRS